MRDTPSQSQIDPALERVLAECIEALESGREQRLDDWIARHPQHADALRELMANHGRLNAIVARVPADPSELHERTILSGDADDDSPPEPANRVKYFGDYELQEEIARGGMGVVFRGRQLSLNRPVAVKMILSGEFASPDDVARFRLEAEAAANLDHPGIVPIYEIGEFEGQHYFSMKHIAGPSLAVLLKQRADIDVTRDDIRRSVELVAEAARAVHYAHQRGIIHRDLKPANILVDADGRPHVTDFGLAKRISEDSQMTRPGAIVGTPSYMSPEQARGGGAAVTTAADIYGLGAILYATLTGRPPFEGETAIETLQKVQQESPRKPSSVGGEIDRELDAVILKCLAKNPDERYRSAGELADDLDRWLNNEPVHACPPNAMTLIWRWMSSNFRAAAAVLLLGIITGWLVVEPARLTQAHNVGNYLGVYRGSFPDLQPPAMLESLAHYPRGWGIFAFVIGLGCFVSMGWWCDWLVRPKASATAAVAGLALGSTAAMTAYFAGVGWTALSQYAVWPVQPDLEIMAATIDQDTSFSDGKRLADAYPGVSGRSVLKKALADLQTRIPIALTHGLLFSVNLLLLPAIVQTLAAYHLRIRGDGAWLRWFYLVELAIPLAVILGGVGVVVYERPATAVGVIGVALVISLALESSRRWPFHARRLAIPTLGLISLLALFAFAHSVGGPFGPGGNNAVLYLAGAAAATTAVVQRWPWWRYLIYAAWVATLLSTFTGPNLTLPSTPEEIAASARHGYVGVSVVLLLTACLGWWCTTSSWKRLSAERTAAASTPQAVARRRTRMLRLGIVLGVVALVGVVASIPLVTSYTRHRQLIEAIDEMQPESIPTIRRLVAEGADISAQGTDNTVPMVAAFWNDPELLKQALDAGADPNASDSFGNTALHFAAFAPSVQPTQLLLDAGANPNARNDRGETPLMGAVRNAQYDQIQLLLAAGAEVDHVSQSGETALSIAEGLTHGGAFPMRPDLTADDFVQLLEGQLQPEEE